MLVRNKFFYKTRFFRHCIFLSNMSFGQRVPLHFDMFAARKKRFANLKGLFVFFWHYETFLEEKIDISKSCSDVSRIFRRCK